MLTGSAALSRCEIYFISIHKLEILRRGRNRRDQLLRTGFITISNSVLSGKLNGSNGCNAPLR